MAFWAVPVFCFRCLSGVHIISQRGETDRDFYFLKFLTKINEKNEKKIVALPFIDVIVFSHTPR